MAVARLHAAPPAPGGDVREILAGLASDRYTAPQAIDRLKALPRNEVVEGLVRQIQRDEERETAYFLLSQIGAADIPAGFGQFLAGLSEGSVAIRVTSARALAGAPAGRRDEAAAALGRALEDEEEASVRSEILRSLARMGTTSAAPHLERIQADFVEAELSEGHRTHAASAMLRVAGIPSAVAVFEEADPAGQRAALQAIMMLGARTRSGWAGHAASREAVAEFVLQATASPDVSTRREAMRALAFVLGAEPGGNSQEQLALNRRIRATLAGRVQSESDSRVATMMRDYLSAIDDGGRVDLERRR